MAINKEKKVEILKKLKDEVLKAKTIVFVNFHKLPVVIATDLRKALRDVESSLFVAKKTLIKLAFSEEKTEGEIPALEGEIAVAYSNDELDPARIVYEFSKKNSGLLKIVGGVFEGKFVDEKTMISIATIPPREILLGQFVNVINSPIQGLVMALNQIAKKSENV